MKSKNEEFHNEAPLDFSLPSVRHQLELTLAELQRLSLARKLSCTPLVANKSHSCELSWKRENPSDSKQILGEIFGANTEMCEETLRYLHESSHRWMNSPIAERTTLLRRLAEAMRSKRYELIALIIAEVGKPWSDADLEVCEAIDFCEYYANAMEALATPMRTMKVPGEDNFLSYHPRGIAVVISPWNFPFAILCGMAVASLVAGNPTILKPAEQSSLIGAAFAKLLLDCGAPPESFAFLPGKGEEIGPLLAEDPRVHIICFTGSRSVGLELVRQAGITPPKQSHIKRVIAELGGKNAIIVDDDADVDEAIKGVLGSAFVYAGQKCSACSRLIVVGDIYESFLERLKDATKDLSIGPATQGSATLGPVIDQETQTRLLAQIETAKTQFTLLVQGQDRSGGYYVPATIFRDVPEDSWLWQEELFGPVLAVRSAKNFNDALRQANASAYKLTGGVFSRSPKNIEEARRFFDVGNLYINRKCTGALVCRQPFGGFGLSGIGSKAGGPDYVLQFLKPRVVTENILRRGFAPDTE